MPCSFKNSSTITLFACASCSRSSACCCATRASLAASSLRACSAAASSAARRASSSFFFAHGGALPLHPHAAVPQWLPLGASAPHARGHAEAAPRDYAYQQRQRMRPPLDTGSESSKRRTSKCLTRGRSHCKGGNHPTCKVLKALWPAEFYMEQLRWLFG